MALYMMSNLLTLNVAVIAAIIYSGQSSFFIQKLNEMLHWKAGCNPIPSLGNVSLHYFAGRGRAEIIRLLLEDHVIPYTETKFTKSTWQDVKQIGTDDGVYTFGQVPAIVTSKNKHLVQSKAITQYIGRSVGIDCDCVDLEKCEVLAAGAEDLYQKKSKVLWNPMLSYNLRNEYVKNILLPWFAHFEKLAPTSLSDTNGLYFVSERLTWVDYIIFEMIESNLNFVIHTANTFETEKPVNNTEELFEKFPRLFEFYRNFKNRPNIVAYVNSDRRFPFSIPYQPKKEE